MERIFPTLVTLAKVERLIPKIKRLQRLASALTTAYIQKSIPTANARYSENGEIIMLTGKLSNVECEHVNAVESVLKGVT